ncbi:flagellar assembly peptidoglycan hydrolase FlgJ [Marinobacterium sp. D7]|uniref:flagellar assembly peptidoglycan hydrolase FlgJ n=1 Tax=Marinobacterium ramblicola TaxID=2849041 RepID=UPI001C2DD5AC|nr:flagellar assembly peptidoglycan hydrolase FlgJ [Marinobacterium ramblicola]MBV1788861.1 flagellar assembly peptidoglycan hydrolase FlgJ [Marinobacterium ramblicola]
MDSKFPGQVDSSFYTDLTGLSKIKSQAKGDRDAALRNAAEQFEQVFMNMMLKSMRQATESFAEDNPFNSSDVQFFQGMLDQQLTLELSQSKGLGLADIIVRQLGGKEMTPDTLRKALQLPSDEERIDDKLNQGQSLNETLLNLAARRVANHSLSAVDQISDRLAQRRSETAAVPEVEDLAAASAAEGAEPADWQVESPEQFVEQLLPAAEKAAQALGVDPRVLVAQAALETGWGRLIIRREDGGSSHNLFNIKADSRWDGERVGVNTLEYRDGLPRPERADFRVYDSVQQSLEDYVDFIQNNPRYAEALQQAGDPVGYLQALQRAGYATDPEYADKIARIVNGTQLASSGHLPQEG